MLDEGLASLVQTFRPLDDNGKEACVQVLVKKRVINDRGKVVDRVLYHPSDEILEFKKGRSNVFG